MKVVSIKIEEDLLELLDAYAINNKLNRSEAIRKAIKEMLKSYYEKKTYPPAKIEKIKL
jgi:metal-responsive CopG/Arc/MetJ family transcriptional regulator